MYSVLLSLYLIVSILLIGLILLQHGKGASMGASFGAGASNTVFGSVGSGNFLTHATAVLATLFFLISLGITALYAHQDHGSSDFDNLQSVAEQSATDAKQEEKNSNSISDVPTENSNVGVEALDSKSVADALNAETSTQADNAKPEDATKAEAATKPEAQVQSTDKPASYSNEIKSSVQEKTDEVVQQGAALKEQTDQKIQEVTQQGEALKSQKDEKLKEVTQQGDAVKSQIDQKLKEVNQQGDALKSQVDEKLKEVNQQGEALKSQVDEKLKEVTQQGDALKTQVDQVSTETTAAPAAK